ncbi:apolipoprotein N-acyltransferase [Alteraurantiacibacter buctensis]|uniref:Apolipoprotein N-acyltransferase n=1 Tax=Alteraurantiacibacter buctensis TaxID=1503981 RepID=A0A844YXR3_9SPHN|nr:apolipoprotein N-acyltransferase [Alteraurantiacibacter buctensis]MXO70867.1 apolipoprotein N-acyltransferase [Alteraurantiacibacter buctensis]
MTGPAAEPLNGGPLKVGRLRAALLRRPAWAALALGVVSATGFVPLGLWPLALLAIGLFAWLLPHTSSPKQAAWLGWLFGWAHFTLGNNWIATAFTYQANMPAVLGWAAVPLLAVYLAVYPMLAAFGARRLAGTRGGHASVLAFAGCWIVAEWLRSWVFTGYSWNPFGMVLLGPFDRPGLAALVPVMGTYALSGLAVLLGAGLVLLLAQRRWLPAGLAAALVTAGMYWPAPAQEDGTLPVTVVQPGIPQPRINDPLFYEANFQRLTDLSRRAVGFDATPARRLVMWPEAGMADYLEEGYPQRHYDRTTALGSPVYARYLIARAIGRDAMLLTGGQRLEFGADRRLSGARNSVLAVDGSGQLVGYYDKAHLVPYGEYLPMRDLLEPLGLSRLVPGSVDFLPGPGPQTMDLGAFGKAGLQICYEIIFSGQVVDGDNRPDYISNGSSDGWFGAAGPPQHFAQARMRAIEEGLPVIRATPSGISGVIDAHGVVRHFLATGEAGRIDTLVPPALPPTLFARLGNMLALSWAALFLLLALVALRQARP